MLAGVNITLTMNAKAFMAWLEAMDISAAEAARLLGVSPNTVTKYKRRGARKETALACSALYHRLQEWK
jgi:DNA-binding CsgD family transcriptional regulator